MCTNDYDTVLPNCFVPQVIGMALIMFICVCLIVHLIRESVCKLKTTQKEAQTCVKLQVTPCFEFFYI